MPLSFTSKSHGSIAFGFFNIDTDMLLLENLFFFADDFCEAVVGIVKQREQQRAEVDIEGFIIKDHGKVGSLHGAIQGVDLSGFIGATYQQFPFPTKPEEFKQKTDGLKNQPFIKSLITDYGKNQNIKFQWRQSSSTIAINQFFFDEETFYMLIDYVKEGGYPKWQERTPPPYVSRMIELL